MLLQAAHRVQIENASFAILRREVICVCLGTRSADPAWKNASKIIGLQERVIGVMGFMMIVTCFASGTGGRPSIPTSMP
jgi:hypothetical protein